MTAQRAAAALTGLVLVVVLAVAAWLGPYVRDDMKLDRIVRTVALDWRDFGKDKAQARLQYELDAQAIGTYVGDDDCRLAAGSEKTVRCAWSVDVALPAGNSFPMSFESTATINAAGDLQP